LSTPLESMGLVTAMLERSPFPQCIISPNFELIAVNKAYRDRYQRDGKLVGTTSHKASHNSDVPCAENGEACPVVRCLATLAPTAVEHIHDEVQGRRKVRIEMEPLLNSNGEAMAFVETIRPQVDHEANGIVMFDIRGFLHQGMEPDAIDVATINKRQEMVLAKLHRELDSERQRRQASNRAIPMVEHFVCTGDGYYLVCSPELHTILDVAHCIRGVLNALDLPAYLVAHVGSVHSFVDMTGRTNVSGFAMGLTARLQSIAQVADQLICSEDLAKHWQPNSYYDDPSEPCSGRAKDGVNYVWRLARCKGGDLAHCIHEPPPNK